MDKQLNKILILEDTNSDIELIKRQLRKNFDDILFAVAHDRKEFDDKISWFDPDLILADYRLPDMNGLEALLHVREHMPGTPFIFLTGALSDEEKVAEAVLKGASGYLLKDNLTDLPAVINKVWQNYLLDETRRSEDQARLRSQQLAIQKGIRLLADGNAEHHSEVIGLLEEVLDSLLKE
ncbi:MAG: response regulator [Saprospiraceae bacterium]